MRRLMAGAACLAWLCALPAAAQIQRRPAAGDVPASRAAAPVNVRTADAMVQLDFTDVELPVVIETIARITGKNFIYDDRVRGRVTIISPTRITVDQAYTVFESMLQVKGFTTVETPGGVIKVIPVRDAKESSIETLRGGIATPRSDRYVTRLIPLRYIDAEDITNTLKPLVSKDAAMVAYAPTNTIILTDSASNIRRILSILDSIDVETYREELAIIKVEYADAATLADQLAEIYGADVASAAAAAARSRTRRPPAVPASAQRAPVRIITDTRTNSLVVMASRARLEEIRRFVSRLDAPVSGEGSIHVYYLQNANAEELAETLNAMISGAPPSPAGGTGAANQPARTAVTGLSEGVTVTADDSTNALVIQATKEAYTTLVEVIEKLDIRVPQVLVEALIMEVDVTDSTALGFNGVVRLVGSDGSDYGVSTGTAAATAAAVSAASGGTVGTATAVPLLARLMKQTFQINDDGSTSGSGSLIEGILIASQSDNSIDIVSAPHILTSDKKEAEIKVGDNIPIVTSRVQSAQGVASDTLATSQNIERRDIGVTLRVTPQISEGDTLRLEIFQEISAINKALTGSDGGFDPSTVGPALSNRTIENTVVVASGETVVIGGLISDDYADIVTKVPWLGDIPFFGWLFKTTARSLTKKNLLVFLTPHIVRRSEDLEKQTIRKREEFAKQSGQNERLKQYEEMEEEGGDEALMKNPTLRSLKAHQESYPLQRMQEIESQYQAEEQAKAEAEAAAASAPLYGVRAGVFRDANEATGTLTELLDAGYDGTLVSGSAGGTVMYEIHLGPYESLSEAQGVASVVSRGYGLPAAVTVVERPAP